jgi:hypothetical protein
MEQVRAMSLNVETHNRAAHPTMMKRRPLKWRAPWYGWHTHTRHFSVPMGLEVEPSRNRPLTLPHPPRRKLQNLCSFRIFNPTSESPTH